MKRVVLLSALRARRGRRAQTPRRRRRPQAGKTLDIYVADTEGGQGRALRLADRADAAHRQRQSRASAT